MVEHKGEIGFFFLAEVNFQFFRACQLHENRLDWERRNIVRIMEEQGAHIGCLVMFTISKYKQPIAGNRHATTPCYG